MCKYAAEILQKNEQQNLSRISAFYPPYVNSEFKYISEFKL